MPTYRILNSKAEVQFKGSFEKLSFYNKDENKKQLPHRSKSIWS